MKLKNRIFYADKTLTILVLLLSFVSCVMVYSTWSITTVVFGSNSALGVFGKQLVFLFASIIFYFAMMHIPYRRFKNFSKLLWIISVALLCIVFLFPPINYSKSWIPLPGFNFQPSEFAKIVLIFSIAAYYDKLITKEIKMDYINWIVKPFIMVFIPIALIIFQPDPGTALIIMLFIFAMFFATGYKFRYIIKSLFKFTPFIIVMVFIFFIANIFMDGALVNYVESSQSRMISRLDYKEPCDDITGSGFQICNSLIAINSGGLNGKGLGSSTQKYLYLPESHTDAIFAVTVEEHGFIKSVGILIIYAIIIYKILLYARKTQSTFAMLTCVGIGFMYLTHIFVNIGGILNIIPFTGVPLPFYSYGGTFSLLCFGALGVVQSVAIEVNREEG
ncbi:MAG: FtsW/RodA/SpoVE family cell cycle protein [Bacilli bacterium]